MNIYSLQSPEAHLWVQRFRFIGTTVVVGLFVLGGLVYGLFGGRRK